MTSRRVVLAAIAGIAFNTQPVLALDPEWKHTWGGSPQEEFNAVAMDANGNAYAVGVSEDFTSDEFPLLLQKYSATGSVLWTKTWNSDIHPRGNGVAISPDGSIVTCGNSEVAGRLIEGLLVKWDDAGGVLWSRTFGTTAFEEFKDVDIDSEGNIGVCGWTSVFSQSTLVGRIRPDGSLHWMLSWTHPTMGEASSSSIAIDDATGDLLVLSETKQSGLTHGLLQRYDSTGALQWSKRVEGGAIGTYPGPQGLIDIDASGNIWIAASVFGGPYGASEMCVMKFSGDGTLQSSTLWGGGSYDDPEGIACTHDGGVIVTGSSTSFAGTVNHIIVGELDASGALIKQLAFGGVNHVRSRDIAVQGVRAVVVSSAPDTAGIWSPTSFESISNFTSVVDYAGGLSPLMVGPLTPTPVVETPAGVVDIGGGPNDGLILSLAIDSLPPCPPLIPCTYEAQDVNCDGNVDVIDVVLAVGVAFRTQPALPPCCAYE